MKTYGCFLTICVGLIVLAPAFINAQDAIRYNVIYDCPAFNDSKGASSGRKFKVLSCDGKGNCKVFSVNEYNPNGGFELDMTRAAVLQDISRYRCVAPGGAAGPREEPPAQNPPPVTTDPPINAGAVACPPSDANADGKAGLTSDFRRAIRSNFEREPEPGLDGRITLTFQSFILGGTRRFVPLRDPLDSQGKSIYKVRAKFKTCTDYNRRIEIDTFEREFGCYKNSAGKYACQVFAAPNTNIFDKKESIDK